MSWSTWRPVWEATRVPRWPIPSWVPSGSWKPWPARRPAGWCWPAASRSTTGARVRGILTEESPLESDLYQRDGYAIAKTWQERIVRRMSQEHRWDLTVIRPGFIWGRDHEYLAGLGQRLGRWHLVFGPSTRLPLTHVENCADCFAEAVENPRAVGQTFNLVDGHDISSWHYLGEYLRAQRGTRASDPGPLRGRAVGFAAGRRDQSAALPRPGETPRPLDPLPVPGPIQAAPIQHPRAPGGPGMASAPGSRGMPPAYLRRQTGRLAPRTHHAPGTLP